VIHNLKLAFPEKSDLELKQIRKKFFKHFVDIFIEIIKSFTISEKQISKRYTFTNIEVLHELENSGKSGILLGAHYANWEWVFNLNLKIKFNGYAVYKKVKNQYFDSKVRSTRGRYKTTLVPTKEIFSVIRENNKQKILSLFGFLGDQSPKPHKAHYWSTFLGVKDVPIHTGVELLAKKYDLAIVSFNTKKIKRGYYESTFKLLTDSPRTFEDYTLTDIYLKDLEKHIKEQPEYYFWTHKRFKHQGKNNK
tara:strand:+ start:447927 stop:448676 length:750 start_codon:yes stop_codon:yes gene_type:complete